MRRSWRLLGISSVSAQPLVSWVGASLTVWILCRVPISRFSTNSLVAWESWEVLQLHQYSRIVPLCFVFGLCYFPFFLSYFLSIILPSYPLYYPSFTMCQLESILNNRTIIMKSSVVRNGHWTVSLAAHVKN